ncbi:MAG: hypothetical protein ACAI35_24445 [Candidatus Methylacidiphilales bacterium]|nr:hypothetical protein [Candidatus Methylacidiphilales bacterium]
MPRPDAIPVNQVNEAIFQIVKEIRVGVGRAQQYGGPMQLPEFVDFQINVQMTADGLTRTEVTSQSSTETPGSTTTTRTPRTTETRTETPGTVTRVAASAVDVTEADPSTDTNNTVNTTSGGGSNTSFTSRDYDTVD